MNVLTDEELEGLLCVSTTIAEAMQIKRRNEALLAGLRSGFGCDGQIGCPHCMLHRSACQTCPWTKHPASAPYSRSGYSACCLLATFGGVAMHDVQDLGLTYASSYEYVRPASMMADEMKEKIEKVLLGHIEWADVVIRLGGVK